MSVYSTLDLDEIYIEACLWTVPLIDKISTRDPIFRKNGYVKS